MICSVFWQRAILTLGLIALTAARIESQGNSPASSESVLQARLQMMKLSSRLRLRAGTERQEGRLVLRNADSIALRGARGEVTIPMAAVDSMWVRRHHTLPGLLIGLAAGAGAYALITKALDDGSDTQELDNLFGGLVWAASTVAGTVVGALIPGWKRVYP